MLAVHAMAGAAAPTPNGQQEFTTAGTFNFTVPANVYELCAVAIGGGDGTGNTATSPGTSSVNNSLFAYGSSGSLGGSFAGADGGGKGGNGGSSYLWHVDGYPDDYAGGGGGGAGGYSGAGGQGGDGGPGGSNPGYGGGGVSLYGEGASGAAGGGLAGVGGAGGGGGGGPHENVSSLGKGGSGGTNGGNNNAAVAYRQTGGLYGGGFGGNGTRSGGQSGRGGGGLGWKNKIAVTPGQVIPIKVGQGGAVRLIWGEGRAFPSTLTGNL